MKFFGISRSLKSEKIAVGVSAQLVYQASELPATVNIHLSRPVEIGEISKFSSYWSREVSGRDRWFFLKLKPLVELGDFFLKSDRVWLYLRISRDSLENDRRRRKFSWFLALEYIFLKNFGSIPRAVSHVGMAELHGLLSISIGVVEIGEFLNFFWPVVEIGEWSR